MYSFTEKEIIESANSGQSYYVQLSTNSLENSFVPIFECRLE